MGHINKRREIDPQGRPKLSWQAEWRDAKGKRKRKSFDTRALAKKHLDAVNRDLLALAEDITVKVAGDLWVQACRDRKLERSTTDAYARHFRIHINPRIGRKKLAELPPPAIEAFKDGLIKDISVELAAAIMGSLRMALSHATRHGKVFYNAAKEVRIKGHTRKREKVKIPTVGEVEAIIQAAHDPTRVCFAEAYTRTALGSGMRPSEMRGLPVWDLRLNPNRGPCSITVSQRADQWGVIGKVKSETALRTIPIGNDLAALLRRWLEVKPKSEGHLVFPSSSGSPQNPSNIDNRVWAPLDVMDLAINRATGPLRLLLVWLKMHGGRISDTLRIEGTHLDLSRGTYAFYVSKKDEPREKPIAPLLWRYYRRFPPQAGQLFPFRNRWAVYKAIDALGVELRPHAMRHALGRALNAGGFGLRTIMETLDHASVNSSLRYQWADVEIVRRAVGESRGRKKNVA